MDQQALRQWEARCTQEEPPQCQAACPLHVDARGLCTSLADGNVNAAWATLIKTMPIPAITARICQGDCEHACLRTTLGGSINLPALERYCAEHATRTPPLRAVPPKGKRIAILGTGLSALAAAWYLARKGYPATLFPVANSMGAAPAEEQLPLSTCLAQIEQSIAAELTSASAGAPEQTHASPTLPAHLRTEHIAETIDQLSGMGVTAAQAMAEEHWAEILSALSSPAEKHPAITGWDGLLVTAPLPEMPPLPLADSALFTTSVINIFATHPVFEASVQQQTQSACGPSPITLVAAGKNSALSLERSLQNVSLTAGREREAPFTSPLSTAIEHITPQERTPIGPQGYSLQQMQQESARCLQCECMQCVNNCIYLAEYKGYPKIYARQIYNNASIVMGTRQSNTMINSCMLCGLCEALCPDDFAMQTLCLDARRDMVTREKMPPSAHEFALRDMRFACSDASALNRPAPPRKGQTPSSASSSKDSSPATLSDSSGPSSADSPADSTVDSTMDLSTAPPPDSPAHLATDSSQLPENPTTVRWAFFPGCQLPATAPEHVAAVYQHLLDVLPPSSAQNAEELSQGDVGLMLHCCGAPAHWAGQEEAFFTVTRTIRTHWEQLGKPELITGCPTCAQMLAAHCPEISFRSLWSVLLEYGLPEHTRQDKQHATHMVIHDPCTTRQDACMHHDVRALARSIGLTIEEPAYSGSTTECCGFGGLLEFANPALGRKASEHRANRLFTADTRAESAITYCAMCRDMLARTGAPTHHLLDLLFPTAGCSAADRPAATLSERRDNRVRLKNTLMQKYWNEDPAEQPAYASIGIRPTPEAAEQMGQLRILESDIQKTLQWALEHNSYLHNAETDTLLASFRPAHVTYWVEFSSEKPASAEEQSEHCWTIHSVWSHRMQIIVPSSSAEGEETA